MSAWGHVALFAGGTLFGSAGFDILSSDTAKKGYTHVIAATLRAKDAVMTNAANTKETWNDMVSDAREINEEHAAKKAAKAKAKAEAEYEDVTDEDEKAPAAAPKKTTKKSGAKK